MADRSVSVLLQANVAGFVAGIEKAKLATKDFAAEGKKSATEHGQAWEKTGRGMMLTGGVIAAGVGLAVKSFMDFDQSMSRAQAGTMATGKSLDALRAAAIKSGADTQFSATEAADAITAMGKAGVSTKDILGGGLTGALSLAAAGELDVASASEIAATAMNQFGLQGKDIPHVADLLAAGAGKAMGSVQDLAAALKYVGPVAKGLNISIEETTGTLAMFAQQGILGEQAGTSMRGMLLSLTSPSKIAKAAMDDLGLTVYGADGKFIGMSGAADQLHDKLGPLNDATRNQALGQIFGNEQITAARVLYEGGAPAVDKWTKSVNDSGFAARQAAMLTANLKGDLERLGGSMSSVLIQSGSGTNDMLRMMTQNLQGVVDRYGALPAPIQQGALALGAVTAAALLTGGALVTLVPKAIAANAALTGMGRSGAMAATALKGLGAASAVLLVGLPLLDAASTAVSRSLGQIAPDAAEAGRALTEFANKGRSTGDSADLINLHWADLGNTINNVMSQDLGHKVSAFFSTISPGNLTGFESSQTSLSIEFFKTLDSGLSDMVANGNAAQAAVLFKRVTDEATAQGYSVKAASDALPAYITATKAASEAAAIEAGSQTTATGAKLTGAAASASAAQSEKDLAKAADEAKKAHDALTASITGYGSAMMAARGDARSYEAAIDAATASLKANGRTLDIGTEKGRNNQAALDGISTSALKVAESSLTAAEANGTLGTASKTVAVDVGQARDAFIKQAVAMGMPKKAAEALATQSGLTAARVKEITDKLIALGQQKPKPTVAILGVAAGLSAVENLRARLQSLKDRNITVSVSSKGGGAARITPASGGYITGPGTGTSDSIPAMLSNGEFVINAASVKRIGVDALHQANKFASGGLVGGKASGLAASNPLMGGKLVTTSWLVAQLGKTDLPFAAIKAYPGALQAVEKAQAALNAMRVKGKPITKDETAATERLTAAQAHLKDTTDQLVSAQASALAMSKQISDQISSGAGLSNIAGMMKGANGNPDITGAGIVANLKGKLAEIEVFGGQLDALRKAGLTGSLVDQITAMGPEQGLNFAYALLGGGGALVKQVNTIQAGIEAGSKSIGSHAAQSAFGIPMAAKSAPRYVTAPARSGVGSLDAASTAERARAVAAASSGVTRLHPADIAAISAGIAGGVSSGMKSAASSTQHDSRNRVRG